MVLHLTQKQVRYLMRDKIGDHEDRMDAIFSRLNTLEDKVYKPEEQLDQLEDLKEEIKTRIIDFDFRLNELELQFEEIKQSGQPRKENG